MGEEAYRVIANALSQGQGAFTEADFEVACLEIEESIVKGEFAALLLEGKLSIKVEGGKLKYATTDSGRAALESEAASQGMSLEQLEEKLRRENRTDKPRDAF